MPTPFNTLINKATNIVHSILVVSLCLYKFKNGDTVNNIKILIDKNKSFSNEFGVIAGYRVEASILKSEVRKVSPLDVFVEKSGDTWRITQITKETTSKWYVDVVGI